MVPNEGMNYKLSRTHCPYLIANLNLNTNLIKPTFLLLPSSTTTTQKSSCQGLPPPFRPLLTERAGITSLHPIHAFLTRNLTHPSQQAAFGKLSAYALCHAILNGIDVFVSGDFRCLEFICIIYIYIYIFSYYV